MALRCCWCSALAKRKTDEKGPYWVCREDPDHARYGVEDDERYYD